jgi:hypothetical protein
MGRLEIKDEGGKKDRRRRRGDRERGEKERLNRCYNETDRF